ncbi:acyltransferase family protein [Vibrio cyclitrophicus]|uniref:acyltransferase n=1 Tax=Vibrio cyclitrophicus TaxID=47951 RepID=UPI000C81F248|nr:acyltransferase family protein [Vibrio cyclitrophicus]MCC4772657.1 acyltransferase family protein [Vibrio cyclitrophicus]MCC4842982.1 acyltransferase family protein [Vibrio cyclitrophicus]PME10463.1 fucose 4-O-acetylase [Vibrio cyclitrophicus]PME41412.1 fucose 4-O-acetylase [Vibrio cyclitrophicus]PME49981.1 fucose 4-O-acetylase [Vibrio cyclitrophicus]
MSSVQHTPAQRIASIELGRVIAILAIIGLHGQMALTYWQINEVPWIGYVLNQAARFAVPLFFLISGYLIQPKLTASPWTTFINYSKPLLKVWLVWSIICLVMPFNLAKVEELGYLGERQGYWGFLMNTPLNSFLEGGLVHLWFLSALMFAVLIIALMVEMKLDKLLLPTAILLYVYGVLAGSYTSLTDLSAPFFTRNGPFFSTLMVTLGFLIRQHQWKVSSTKALGFLAIGMFIHFAEAAWLTNFDVGFNMNDFLFGTTLWGVGVFMWLLANPNIGNYAWVRSISNRMLGIYVSHLLVIIVLFNVCGILGITEIGKDITVFFGTFILSFMLVSGIEKTPLQRWLLR